MQELINRYRNLLASPLPDFERSLTAKIDWKSRGICITGARGVGKSTLMLQYIRKNLPLEETLYISMDDLYFHTHTLLDTGETFYMNGGRYLFVDEVHKYIGWERDVKTLYDFHPDLKLVVSGSSILALQRSESDLSRRMLYYHLPELSIREYLAISERIVLPVISFQDLLGDHQGYVDLVKKEVLSPIRLFTEFQNYGAYPFFAESKETYMARINQLINVIIDYDLPEAGTIEISTRAKLKKLLYVISTIVPFTPNISRLATQVGTSRIRLLEMLNILEKAQLILNLHSATKGISLMNKPQKIYLHNTSLIMALAEGMPNKGNLRETFLFSQLTGAGHLVTSPPSGDFLVEGKTTLEVGGKNKDRDQIKNIPDAFLALDGIEYGAQGTIPLWLFGFLY